MIRHREGLNIKVVRRNTFTHQHEKIHNCKKKKEKVENFLRLPLLLHNSQLFFAFSSSSSSFHDQQAALGAEYWMEGEKASLHLHCTCRVNVSSVATFAAAIVNVVDLC